MSVISGAATMGRSWAGRLAVWLVAVLAWGGAGFATDIGAVPPEARRFVFDPAAGSLHWEAFAKGGWSLRYVQKVGQGNSDRYSQVTAEVVLAPTEESAAKRCQRTFDYGKAPEARPQLPFGGGTMGFDSRLVLFPAAPRTVGYPCHNAYGYDRVMPYRAPYDPKTQTIGASGETHTISHSDVFAVGPWSVTVTKVSESDTKLGPPAPLSDPADLLGRVADMVDAVMAEAAAPKPPPPPPPKPQVSTGPAKVPAPPVAPVDPHVLTSQQQTLVQVLLSTPEGKTLLGTLAATGLASLAALFLAAHAGVPTVEALGDLQKLLRGQAPSDPFEDWKAKYTALGWKYSQENGVAKFTPVEGARDEYGRRYDPASGTFVDPTPVDLPPEPVHHDGEVRAETGEVWSDEDHGWVGSKLYAQEKQNRVDAARIAEVNRTAETAWDRETRALAHDIAVTKAEIAAQAAADATRRAAMVAKLTSAYAAEGRDTAEIADLAASGDTAALTGLYGDHLRQAMAANAAEARSSQRWATAMDVGYYASKAVLAGAKTGMMVVGGPAGYGAVALGSGLISGVEEAAAEMVSKGASLHAVASFGTGFLSGAKDGLVGRYVALPGTGTAVKILLPASADAAEMYARSGDVGKSMETGLLSAAGGLLGHGLSGADPSLARQGGELLLGGTVGAAQRYVTDGNAMEGFADGLVNATGAKIGGHVVGTGAPMTAKDVQMNVEAANLRAEGEQRVAALTRALASGNEADKAAAMHAVLDSRDAKLLMKSGAVDPDTKAIYAGLVEDKRTQPLFAETAKTLSNATFEAKDGTTSQRFVVEYVENGVTKQRPVTAADLASGSGAGGKEPGMDLDMSLKAKVVDLSTGREMKHEHFEAAVGKSCQTLGIDKRSQEIVAIDPRGGAEAFTLKPGETPKEFIGRAGGLSGREGQSVAEVTGYKVDVAVDTHGVTAPAGSSALSEQCRAATKDYARITEPMLREQPGARLPEVFTRVDAATGDSALDIMRKVGTGEMQPGTGNARFRALTGGLSLDDGSRKLASLPEFLAKGREVGLGGTPRAVTPPQVVWTGGTDQGIEMVSSSALRDALRTGLRTGVRIEEMGAGRASP